MAPGPRWPPSSGSGASTSARIRRPLRRSQRPAHRPPAPHRLASHDSPLYRCICCLSTPTEPASSPNPASPTNSYFLFIIATPAVLPLLKPLGTLAPSSSLPQCITASRPLPRPPSPTCPAVLRLPPTAPPASTPTTRHLTRSTPPSPLPRGPPSGSMALSSSPRSAPRTRSPSPLVGPSDIAGRRPAPALAMPSPSTPTPAHTP